MKVLCVFGTRPEAIKMAPVVKELRKYSAQIETRVCVTAQHREMLDQVLALFGIIPDYDLDIMQSNQTLAQVTASVLQRLEPVITGERPDWVLAQGDTTTVMATALVAFYHRVRMGHVEAGLRTWNKYHPFPEEINRKVADAICDLHFAPTEIARQNLLHEGVEPSGIHVTGNTVIDALFSVVRQPPSPEVVALFERLGIGTPGEAAATSDRLILVTAHRRENFGEPIRHICAALRQIAGRYQDVRIVYPVHMNPNVRQVAREMLGGISQVTLLEPLEYDAFVYLMKRSYLVLTDSGGLQEEAPAFGVPVLVMRETTERPEAIDAGTARLVGTNTESIIEAVTCLLDDAEEHREMAQAINPFGDGHASERIVKALLEFAG